ncbi:M16 family metallopeptidase [Bacteroides ihuae]|uniref:M16 family metallopeptidase n=1 Tax=Bacteroides ihuae TaxID=1852362 RepID=UPI0008D98BB1|nr:M16 family metallopeptidase [Bacteroides ihuae]
MKKSFSFILLLLLPWVLQAQSSAPLPIDPGVRTGKLDNGLTYYIRHNAYPEKRAEFYIAQNVGSILEEDSQSGLAHFLEHMAFNGTKHYPGRKNMLDYLEKNGAKFGENVNAYTSFDQTVYNLSDIPVHRESLVDSCLLILHDWSSFITLDNAEIDKERSIIKEEWRTRNSASLRNMEHLFAILFKDTRYANRMPIGSMDVVEHFPYQQIKDYYHKWYRPDLQAIVVVGDIDVDHVEATIKTMFADIKKPVNPAHREYFTVPEYTNPIATVLTDPETTSTNITVYYPHEATAKAVKHTEEGYNEMLLEGFVSNMLSTRLAEITQKAGAPFMRASAGNGNYIIAKTKEAWALSATCKEGEVLSALRALVDENERAKQFGFTQAELDRIKTSYLEMYANSYNNRNKQNNAAYVREYVGNFTDDEPIPGIEYEYELVKKLIPKIDLNAVNECLRHLSATPNMVVSVTGPQKEGVTYPSEKELIDVVQNVAAQKLTAYEEKVISTNLIDSLPAAGKVVKVKKNEKMGATEWTLSNGMRVVLKKTDYKDDQVLMSSVAYGGNSLFADSEIYNASFIRTVPSIGGVGAFSAIDLGKALAGKSANVNASVGSSTESLSGSSSIKDVETLLQLTHLYFTAPRKDEQAYAAFIGRLHNQLKNAAASPPSIMNDTVSHVVYGDNPRMQRIHLEDLSKLNYDRMIEMYKEVFANPSAFTFVFVGSIDEATLRPLVEKYLASLPAGNKNIKNKKVNDDIRKGNYTNIFTQKMEAPKATSLKLYSGILKRTHKNEIAINVLNQVLDVVYTRTVREAEGGTYGVSTGADISRLPDGRAMLQIMFDTNPEKERHLSEVIRRELGRIATDGPEAVDFNKTKEYMEKSYQEGLKTNGYWLGVLSTLYFYNEDYNTDYLKTLESVTQDDVKNLTNELLKQKNLIEVVMMPKE